MAQSNSQQTDSPPVEQIAALVRGLSRLDQARLFHLVPDLRQVEAEARSKPSAQPPWTAEDLANAITYFEERMTSLPDSRPMRDDDPFIADLTVGEFFALPEARQKRLWDEAHRKAARELETTDEQLVRSDTLPAR